MKLLIVDDETKIQLVLKEYANYEGYETDLCSSGFEAINLAKENDYDLIIMDVMMPGLDGFSAVKEIKKFKDIPVLMLSARSEEYDKLHGFEIGIDDYVTKPFSPKEVMLRVNAITRRSKKKTNNKKYGGLEIDIPGRNVYVDGKRVDLTPREYELLFYLINNEGIVVTREQLLSQVWGYDYFGDDRTVDTHIKMLRNNLGPYRDYIVTARGMGYKFEVEEH